MNIHQQACKKQEAEELAAYIAKAKKNLTATQKQEIDDYKTLCDNYVVAMGDIPFATYLESITDEFLGMEVIVPLYFNFINSNKN